MTDESCENFDCDDYDPDFFDDCFDYDYEADREATRYESQFSHWVKEDNH